MVTVFAEGADTKAKEIASKFGLAIYAVITAPHQKTVDAKIMS